MTKHLFVNQLRQETTVPPIIIRKIYNDIIQHELTGDVYDNTTDYIGEITLAAPTYKEWADKVHESFPDLIINSLYYMLFQDSNVESIMSNWLLSKGVGDGVGITYDDAKNNLIVSLPSFKNNTSIEYFNELQHFLKITTINNSCFENCTNLKEINLSNITNLGNYEFKNDTSLEKVVLGNISTISDTCFYGCRLLENVINGENITTVNSGAFNGCSSLETIDLSNCTSIGNNAFQGCSGLQTITLNNNITELPQSVFQSCGSINIDVSNITKFNRYCLSSCTLESITLNNNITELGQDALHGITVNSEVVIPASVTVLGSNVFNSFRPKHIKFLSSVPATTDGDAFYGFATQSGGKIRVPAGSLETYKNAVGWERIKNNTNWEEY